MALAVSPQSPSTGPIPATSHRAPVARWAFHLALEWVAEACRPPRRVILTTPQLAAGLAACVGTTSVGTALLALALR